MAKYTVALKGDAEVVLEYLLQHPAGATIEDIEQATGVRGTTAYGMAYKMSKWMRGVEVKRAKKKMPAANGKPATTARALKMLYYPATPDVVVAVATKTAPAGKATRATTVPQPVVDAPEEGGTKATEVVFANAPDIPDVRERYKFFDTPSYYKLMADKVLIYGKHILMKGSPGIGKSTAWEVLAARELRPCVNINAESGLKARQLIGGMSNLGRFEVAQFAAAVVQGWWAKIDEANAMDADAALCLNSLLAPPYQIVINGKAYNVHPEFRLCITYNPGLVGTKPLPDSLKDRFYPIPVEFPGEARLKKMLQANGVDMTMPECQEMAMFALAVHKLRGESNIRFDITLRRLMDAWSDLQDGNDLYTALRQSVVGAIDNVQDIARVQKLLDDTVQRSHKEDEVKETDTGYIRNLQNMIVR